MNKIVFGCLLLLATTSVFGQGPPPLEVPFNAHAKAIKESTFRYQVYAPPGYVPPPGITLPFTEGDEPNQEYFYVSRNGGDIRITAFAEPFTLNGVTKDYTVRLSCAACVAGQIPNFFYTVQGPSGPQSNWVHLGRITILDSAQAITFGTNPGPVSYSPSGTFTVSGTGGASNNPVTFTSTTPGVCTTVGTNGATVTIVTAGTCTIAANQAENANYYAATQVTQSITINRANQTMLTATSTSTSLNVGQTATLGSTGGSGTGTLSFASNNANCTVSGTTLTAAAAGGCTITATKAADTNYNAASSAGLVILDEKMFSNGFE